MLRTGILSIILLLSLCAFSQTDDTLLLKTKTGLIEGSLLLPNKDLPVPVVLIIAGSGPTDRDGNNPMMKNNSLKMLANDLAQTGIASLRFDKRGIARSKDASPGEINMRLSHFVEDAAAWVGVLADDDRFSSVTIIGHSIGSLIGMLASQSSSTDGFVSLSGPGFPAGQILRDQLAEQSENVMKFSEPILERLERGETVDTIDPLLMSLFRPSVQPYLMSWMAYDPAEEIGKLEIPVMIALGSTDIQVPLKNAVSLATAQPEAKLDIVTGMNHVLKKADPDRMKNLATYYDPELPVVPKLIQNLSSFIFSVDLQ
ncbi:MAG: alpha/beta hydrolase [Bacteroidetes bacterium]|nr:alpha/beta hydrolase [Bacteroidota bacterium]